MGGIVGMHSLAISQHRGGVMIKTSQSVDLSNPIFWEKGRTCPIQVVRSQGVGASPHARMIGLLRLSINGKDIPEAVLLEQFSPEAFCERCIVLASISLNSPYLGSPVWDPAAVVSSITLEEKSSVSFETLLFFEIYRKETVSILGFGDIIFLWDGRGLVQVLNR